MSVNFIKGRRIGQVVQIHIGCDYLTEIHSRLLEIVEKIAHSLSKLMIGATAYTPPCGPWMKPLLAEQYKVSPTKTHGLAVGLGGMFFGRTALRC